MLNGGFLTPEMNLVFNGILILCQACAICVEVEGAMESVPLGADTLARLSS